MKSDEGKRRLSLVIFAAFEQKFQKNMSMSIPFLVTEHEA